MVIRRIAPDADLNRIADIVLGHGLELQQRCDVNFAEYPALAAYHARLKARPAAAALFQR